MKHDFAINVPNKMWKDVRVVVRTRTQDRQGRTESLAL